ncbi:Phytoene/squalene synthetase [Jannaschia faecimaris]|uniref:Phytoene/squalene synthetase n=1 Tax=Jannaschia faecimaris TaxID=1244108 RepID=A0A1H3P3Q3_9RHOB|nr:squalene/phytoene synthase family protein [Jannaschia faecimaris]SDY95737.1 Phytoene/squalene synthetase [Jannaschia faecimaris]
MDIDEQISACAGLVQRGDPDRFRAVMAAPVGLRRMLFPLYAFNLEVARAPWVTKEPLIAEMRLQWWRDALGEIAGGGNVRRHEVVTPLAQALDPRAARDLDGLIDARRKDIEGRPPASVDDLTRYLDRTAGTLLWTAARLAGAADAPAIRDAGLAYGMAAWLKAVPGLVEKGRQPLPPGEPHDVISGLAKAALDALDRFAQSKVEKPARAVLLVLSDTRAELRAFAAHPGQTPQINPAISRIRLGWHAVRT